MRAAVFTVSPNSWNRPLMPRKTPAVTAPLPDHMMRTWKTLGWHENDVPDDPFDEDA